MRSRAFLLVISLACTLLAGCDMLPFASTPESLETQPLLPTALLEQELAEAVPIPTESPRTYFSYKHRTDVFTLNIPEGWEAIDESTDQRLLVRFIAPPGYASRVTVEVTNEGPLPPERVRELANSYLRLHYTESPSYTQLNQDELPDGRLRLIFNYNDGRGGTGRETLLIQQTGPYFAALRVFQADVDANTLSAALETVTVSFSIDSLALWGTQVASINPAELLVANTNLWQVGNRTYYAGEVFNASPATITETQIRIAFCSDAGIVLSELVQPALRAYIPRGESAPFLVTAEGLPRTVRICIEQATARPAQPNSIYTNTFVVESSLESDQRGVRQVRGRITNPELSPVTSVDITIALYDDTGRVVGIGRVDFGDNLLLPPGESREFVYTLEGLADIPDHFSVLAEGRLIDLSGASLVPTPSP